MFKPVVIGALGLTLFLGACDESADTTAPQKSQPVSEMMMADVAPQGAALMRSAPVANAAPRMEVGRTYRFELAADGIDAALEADRVECLKLECVISAVSSSDRDGRPYATLRAYVPGDKASQFHSYLSNLDERDMVSFNETAASREDQYQDVKSRLERLEFMKKRLYALANQKSDKVGNLLQVERELMRVESEIEQLTRSQKGIEKVTDNEAFSITYAARPLKAGDVNFDPLDGLFTETLNTAISAVRITVLWIARWLPAVLLVLLGFWWVSRRKSESEND